MLPLEVRRLCVAAFTAVLALTGSLGTSQANTAQTSPSSGATVAAHLAQGERVGSPLHAAPASSTPDPALARFPPALPRPSAMGPSGAVFETPNPAPPTTTPVTFVLLLNSRSCCVTQYINAPVGAWQMILLNYTGQAVNGVYDSSYSAMVDGVPVLFGTTPEYGQWTVLKDVTEYTSLFQGNTTVQFTLGAAVTNGYFLTSVGLSFYPVVAGTAPPREPNQIVPLWPYTSETDVAPNTTVVRSVPTNVSNATLEIYAYGFTGGSGLDEFWYTLTPPYRTIRVTVDGRTFASILPFPYVNTGGIDLFAWDPITGVFTLNDRPYQVDVTAALGLLEGSHSFQVQVLGRAAHARWIAGGCLLLYTDPSVRSATLTASAGPTAAFRNTSIPGGLDENVTTHLSFSSDIVSTTGTTHVTSWTNGSFDGSNAASQRVVGSTTVQNSTTTLVEATHELSRWNSPTGSGQLDTTSHYSLGLNSTDVFNGTGAVGTYLNVTSTIHFLHQAWNDSRLDIIQPVVGNASSTGSSFQDQVAVDGRYAVEEYIVSAGAAQVVKEYFNFQNTSKTYRSLVTSSPLTATYAHTLSGRLASTTQPQETILANAVQITDAAAARADRVVTDAGQSNRLVATPFGAGGPFTFQWTGLPAGCATTGQVVSCAPTAAGTYSIRVTIVGATGNSASSTTTIWTVLSDPTVTATVTPSVLDVGSSVNLTGSITGGRAPFTCTWVAGGVLLLPPTPCVLKLNYTPTATQPTNISLNVTDSLGVTSHALPVSVLVMPDPEVVLQLSVSSTIVPLGTPFTLTAVISGGVGPFKLVWYSNGTKVTQGVSGNDLTMTPKAAGTLSILVTVTDAVGYTSSSVPAVITVTGGTSGGGGGTSGGTPAWLDTTTLGIIVISVLALVVVVLLAVRLRRR